MVAAATIGSAVVGGVVQSSAAGKAAKAQTSAADAASQVQQNMFDTTQANLAPYMGTGVAANNQLAYLMGLTPQGSYYSNMAPTGTPATASTANALTQNSQSGFTPIESINDLTPEQRNIIQSMRPDLLSPFNDSRIGNGTQMMSAIDGVNSFLQAYGNSGMGTGQGGAATGTTTDPNAININPATGGFGSLAQPVTMDEATLEQTPGYQFNLTQGLKAAQNSATARGLGTSGAAVKGAETYATGLADSTYQNQFNNQVTNQTNLYNRLTGVANSGQNAAAGLGTTGQQTAANIGSNIIGAGNASAAGTIGGANALSGAGSNASSMYMMNQFMNGMYDGDLSAGYNYLQG